jgi:hypothetical protein
MKATAIFSSIILLLALNAQESLASETPLSIHIAASSEKIRSGARLTLIVTATNTSDHEIPFEEAGMFCDYKLDVRDDTGNSVPNTPLGQQFKWPCEGTGMDIISFLKSGESREERLSVTDIRDLSRLGVYAIQVSRQIPFDSTGVFVKSNKITITLIP